MRNLQLRLAGVLFLSLQAPVGAVAQTPAIVLSPPNVTLSAITRSGLSSAQTVAVTSAGRRAITGMTRTISYPAGQPRGWLIATLSSSTTPATLTLQGRASATLFPGTYSATVTVRTWLLSQTVAVSFRVLPNPPAIDVAATANLTGPAGSLTPVTLQLDVTNAGGGTLGGLQASVSYPVGETTGWLTAVLGRPNAPTKLRLRATPAQDLLPGVHHATVRITSPQASNSPRLVDVAFNITGFNPLIALSPSSVSFIAIGPGDPPSQSVAVTNAGGGTVERLTRTITYGAGQPTGWLRAGFGAKEAPTTLELRAVNTPALAPGVYTATVEVNSPTAFNSPETVAVTLGVGSSPAHLTMTPTAHDFGSVGVGGASAAQAFTISNDGGLPSGPLTAPNGPFSPGALVGGVNAADFRGDPTSSCLTSAGGLAPNTSCTIVLWFSPTGVGARIASLNVGASPGGNLQATLTGTGTSTPVIVVTPPSHNYGDVGGGTPIPTQRFVLTNPLPWPTGPLQPLGGLGNNAIIGGPNPGDFSVESNSTCVQVLATGLPAGGNCFFDVTFIPQGLGARSAVLTFQMNPGGLVAIALSGNGLGIGFLSISPTSHNFGSVGIGGASAAQAFTITNNSNLPSGPFTPTSGAFGITLGLGGANAADFRPDPTSSCVGAASGLAPHTSCDIVFWFSPTGTGARSAALSLSASPGGTVSATLSGTGTTAPGISIAPAARDYGDVGVGRASPVQRFVLTNTLPWPTGPFQPIPGPFGIPAPLVSGPNPGDFIIDQNSSCAQASAGLPVGGSCYFDVTFVPQDLGTRSALLAFQMNPGGVVQIQFSGNGVAAQILTLTPTSHDFGIVDVGTTSAAQRFTLTNTGATATGRIVPQGPGGATPEDFNFTLVACSANSGGGLDPGATCTFDVSFTPTFDGTRSAFVTFAASPGGSATVQLTGEGRFTIALPVLALTPAQFDFGSVPINTTATHPFTVTNQSQAPTVLAGVVLVGTNSDGFGLGLNAADCTGIELGPQQHCTFNVNFSPTVTGLRSRTLTVSDFSGNTASSSLTGTGVAPPVTLTLAPASFDFGTLPQGQSRSATFTVTNTTGSAVLINQVDIVGDASDFALNSGNQGCFTTLAPGSSCGLSVVFTPHALGARSATVSVSSGPGTPSGSATLSGTGGPASALVIDPALFAFGPVLLGTSSPTATFIITNSTASPTGIINSFVLTGTGTTDYAISQLSCAGAALSPGGQCSFTVTFKPTIAGGHPAILTITTTQGESGAIELRGNGILPAVLSITPTTHDFGFVTPGGLNGPVTFTVTNTGAGISGFINFFGISITGPDSTNFVFLDDTWTCFATIQLPPGASCTINVVFLPEAAGPRTARLNVVANGAGGGSATATLTGGRTPAGVLTITPTSKNFGSLPVGLFSLPTTFTARNTGTTPALIFNIEFQGVGASSYGLEPGLCQPGMWIAVGAQCLVDVTFRPQSLGTVPATLVIQYDAGSASASLTGVGTPLSISASSAQQDLLGIPTLADSERVHLDLLGNRDGVYDLGDLLAFLDRNHLKVSAAMLAAPRRKENTP